MTDINRTGLITWDWRGQPDLDYLAQLLTQVSGGTVHLAKVETGSDEYAVVLSNEPITAERAQEFYQTRWEGEDE